MMPGSQTPSLAAARSMMSLMQLEVPRKYDLAFATSGMSWATHAVELGINFRIVGFRLFLLLAGLGEVIA